MRRLLAILLLLTLPAAAGKKKSLGTMYTKAGQKVEITNVAAALGVANRKCENYAWAAIVETMMRAQQVPIKQNDWALRTSGGEKCFPSLDDYAQRSEALNGDYTLDDGRKIRIHADYVAGTGTSDTLVYSLRIGHPLLVVYNGRPYLLGGIVYDELIHSSGKANVFIIRELHLLDAAVPANSPNRNVVVKKEGDDALADITGVTGVMSVTVDARNFYDIPSR
jgi:hypothetical protein